MNKYNLEADLISSKRKNKLAKTVNGEVELVTEIKELLELATKGSKLLKETVYINISINQINLKVN